MGIKNTSKVKKLGDLLVEVGLLTDGQIKEAVEMQRIKGGKLGDVLVDLKFLTREVLLTFLGKRCGVSYVSLSEFGSVTPEVLALIPESVARQQALLPLQRRGEELTVAMADPLNVFAIDDLKHLTGCEIKVVIAAEGEISSAIESYYGEACEVPSIDGQVHFASAGEEAPSLRDPGSPAVNILNVLLDNAVRAGVSAVHLEPGENSIKVRYRLRDRLVPRPEIAGKFQEGLSARLKSLAHMNPLETWAPQEGHIRAKVNGRDVDIRASTLPTFYGEKIVLRFIEGDKIDLDLESLGFDARQLPLLRKSLEAFEGLTLIAGAAGAGKTTTFYASLAHVLQADRHVATLEDPVERCLPGVIQVQARPHVGLTVASGIRSLLRQDPDLIGVGDIRHDDEAAAALEAVQAGVPVLAAVRSSTVAGAVSRFLEAGLPAEAVASALKAVVLQRWAQKLCPSCRESYNLPRQTLLDMGFDKAAVEAAPGGGTVRLFRAKGCGACGQAGVQGRIFLATVVAVDGAFREAIRRGDPARFPVDPFLRGVSLGKALLGEISLDEALR